MGSLQLGHCIPRVPRSLSGRAFLARRPSPDDTGHATQHEVLGLIGGRQYRRTAHAAARRFGLQRRGRPLREFQSSSAKVFALELQAMNTAMDNLSLIPRPGSLAWPGTHGQLVLGSFLSSPYENVLLQRTRHVVTRRRDQLIDKKIGSVIRMRRLKLGLTQADRVMPLGWPSSKFRNTRMAQTLSRRPVFLICVGRLEMMPNDLFGVSSKMDGEVSKIFAWAMNSVEVSRTHRLPCDKRSMPCSTRGQSDKYSR